MKKILIIGLLLFTNSIFSMNKTECINGIACLTTCGMSLAVIQQDVDTSCYLRAKIDEHPELEAHFPHWKPKASIVPILGSLAINQSFEEYDYKNASYQAGACLGLAVACSYVRRKNIYDTIAEFEKKKAMQRTGQQNNN
jgi:hypothetical protein